MCASRGFEYACSERRTFVRMPNRDVLPTCGRPMMPVFMGKSQLSAISSVKRINHWARYAYARELHCAVLRWEEMQLKRTTHHRQFYRYLAGVLLACIACGASSSAQSPSRIHFLLQTRDVVEDRLKSFSTKNSDREALIRNWFAESGCKGANLFEQALERNLPPNVICVLPGETQQVILVGAHTDKVDSFGDGVVDNWTGAVLLTALFESLSGQLRHHTLIFVGFSGEEKGLVGSQYYVDHLTHEQRAHIEGMVNFDSLGLGPTEVWASHADKVLLDALAFVAAASKLPVTAMKLPEGATADSESFAR